MITLMFNGQVNTSLSIGDTVYYVNNISDLGTFDTGDVDGVSNIIELGVVTSIMQNVGAFTLLVNEVAGIFGTQEAPLPDEPNVNSFILFSKDNSTELSSILGYYNKVRLTNDSTEKAELFSVAVDVTQSSK